MFARSFFGSAHLQKRFFSASVSPKRKFDVGIYVFGGITALTCGLGVWQSARYFWKVDLLNNRNESLSLEPIDLTERGLTEEEASVSFRRVQVSGVLDTDPAHQVVLTPRVPPKDVPQRLLTAAQAGYNLVAPFTSDSGEKMMVMRGWVPADVKLAGLASHAAAADTSDAHLVRTIVFGVLRADEEPGVFGVSSRSESPIGSEIPVASKEPLPIDRKDTKYKSGDNYSGSAGVLTYISRKRIAQLLGLVDSDEVQTKQNTDAPGGHSRLPLLIELIQPFPDASVPPQQRYPITRQLSQLSEAYVDPQTHVIYAFTWFTLSVFGYFLTKRRFKVSARGAMRKLSHPQ